MKTKENYGSGSCGRGNNENVMGNSTQFTDDQVMVLEKLFGECAKPSHSQRLGMVCENPALSDLDSEQIKGWFQNRRFLEKQRKAAFEFQSVNDKMEATKKLLLEENDFLRKELLQLVRENEYIRKLLQNVTDSVANSDQCSSMSADNSKRNCSFFLSPEETMREFSPTATQSALGWVSTPRMKVFERVRDMSLRTCSNLFYFPTNEILSADSVQLFIVRTAMPLAISSFDVDHKLSPFAEVVTGANWIYQSSRFKLGGEWLRINYQIPETLLKQLCNQQDWLLCCSFEETDHDQISRTVGQESPPSVVPPIVPQVINLYLVDREEQGPFSCGYISCK